MSKNEEKLKSKYEILGKVSKEVNKMIDCVKEKSDNESR